MSRLVTALALAAVLAGCAAPPPPAYLSAPADATRTGRAAYASVTAGTRAYRPVEPKGWDDVNRKVAPRSEEKRP
jgi:hypothetical protein